MSDEGERDEAALRPHQQLLRQLRMLALLAVAVVLIGFVGGWLFGQTRGPAAARRVLAGRVEYEPAGSGGSDSSAPTFGGAGGDAACGVLDTPLSATDQVALLQLGGALIQYRPADLDDEERGLLGEVVGASLSHVAAAPNPDLDAPVVATALERRLRLDDVDVTLLRAFVVGYIAPTGPASDCPTD